MQQNFVLPLDSSRIDYFNKDHYRYTQPPNIAIVTKGKEERAVRRRYFKTRPFRRETYAISVLHDDRHLIVTLFSERYANGTGPAPSSILSKPPR